MLDRNLSDSMRESSSCASSFAKKKKPFAINTVPPGNNKLWLEQHKICLNTFFMSSLAGLF